MVSASRTPRDKVNHWKAFLSNICSIIACDYISILLHDNPANHIPSMVTRMGMLDARRNSKYLIRYPR